MVVFKLFIKIDSDNSTKTPQTNFNTGFFYVSFLYNIFFHIYKKFKSSSAKYSQKKRGNAL